MNPQNQIGSNLSVPEFDASSNPDLPHDVAAVTESEHLNDGGFETLYEVCWIRANEYLTQKAANLVRPNEKNPNNSPFPQSYPQPRPRNRTVTKTEATRNDQETRENSVRRNRVNAPNYDVLPVRFADSPYGPRQPSHRPSDTGLPPATAFGPGRAPDQRDQSFQRGR